MSEIVREMTREMTREELVAYNNELRLENEKLKEKLEETKDEVEHYSTLLEKERLKREFYRKDGEISGLRFALRCITEGCHGKAVLDEVE